MPKNLEMLRTTPVMRDEKTIRKIFRQRKYPAGLFEVLWQPVWDRCHEQGDTANWWRKGFAYALVFSGPSKGNWGELRIMPGVYTGPGGLWKQKGISSEGRRIRSFLKNKLDKKAKTSGNWPKV